MKRPAPAVLAALLLAGCGSHAPKLVPPDSVDSFCPGAPARGAAVVDVISSVADAIQPVDVPNDAVLQKLVKEETGVIGHWKAEPLYMPGTAKALGVSGDYIEITDVVIPNQLSGSDSRTIYATIQTPAGAKRVALRAYDLQNVCAAGKPD